MLKKVNPTTSSRRHLIQLNNKKILNTFFLIKKKIIGLKKSVGKNNTGSIVSYHKGGGNKKRYRKITFDINFNSTGIVMTVEYDPNRNCFIAAIYNFTIKTYYYMLAPHKLKVGDIIKTGVNADHKLGHCLTLSDITVGSFLFNVSFFKNYSYKSRYTVARSAGTFCKLIEKNNKVGKIMLPSGKINLLKTNNFATLGVVSNIYYSLATLGKAGRSRWFNKRPIVRGVAMNPVDHPHGGGEGKTSGGRKSSVTPWGKSTKGGKTKKKLSK